MPISDEHSIFVAAMIGIAGDHPDLVKPIGNSEWLCNKLRELGAMPTYDLVVPFNGYEEALIGKLSKMNSMALATRDITGANSHLFSGSRGFQFRNMVWTYAMHSALQTPMLRAVLNGPVTGMEVYFDQKTMAHGMRILMRTAINNLLPVLREVIASHAHLLPIHAQGLLDNIRFNEIQVKWSDEDGAEMAKGGLKLAHYLASITFRDRKQGKTTLAQTLINKGFNHFETDITSRILAPLDNDTVESWKSLTGLSEP